MECLCQRWSATWFPKCHTPAHNQANGLKTCHEIRVVFKWEPSWEDNARDQTPVRFIILLDMVKYHDLVELKVASTPSKPPNYLFSLSPRDKNRNWTNLCEIMWCASPTTLTESIKISFPPFSTTQLPPTPWLPSWWNWVEFLVATRHHDMTTASPPTVAVALSLWRPVRARVLHHFHRHKVREHQMGRRDSWERWDSWGRLHHCPPPYLRMAKFSHLTLFLWSRLL